MYEGGLLKGLQFTRGAYLKASNLRGRPIKGLQFTRGSYLKDSNL